nr:immunoglobulin heavy chain junction region [Macaca mulatta]MOV47498.1 immunoglobulin heavy chain junction region [Macaca mulatta]MOV47500.1 immunoglobulin heavy chain junction region [Macaca mulatta]MOV47506.1 immunoglobulin heavy chain junction region [Macaca mulatta]MOV47532.1 immunoglobulin heavy chain junction region [Macaca mulatta]
CVRSLMVVAMVDHW